MVKAWSTVLVVLPVWQLAPPAVSCIQRFYTAGDQERNKQTHGVN